MADLNNERAEKNNTYAARLASLDRFVLIASTVDKIIVPRESSWCVSHVSHEQIIDLRTHVTRLLLVTCLVSIGWPAARTAHMLYSACATLDLGTTSSL